MEENINNRGAKIHFTVSEAIVKIYNSEVEEEEEIWNPLRIARFSDDEKKHDCVIKKAIDMIMPSINHNGKKHVIKKLSYYGKIAEYNNSLDRAVLTVLSYNHDSPPTKIAEIIFAIKTIAKNIKKERTAMFWHNILAGIKNDIRSHCRGISPNRHTTDDDEKCDLLCCVFVEDVTEIDRRINKVIDVPCGRCVIATAANNKKMLTNYTTTGAFFHNNPAKKYDYYTMNALPEEEITEKAKSLILEV